MAAKKRMYLIRNGPSLLELMFSEYHLEGHVVEFTVEECADSRDGEVTTVNGWRQMMHCQVIGSDRIERIMKDAIGREIPGTARLIRVRYNGVWLYEGWYNAGAPRWGLLCEVDG